METAAFLAQIRQQIERNDLKGAIKQLKKLLKKSPQLNEVLQQSARHSKLSQKIRTGKIDLSEASLAQNQISWGLLQLISEIESQAEQPEIEAEIQQLIQKNIVKKSKLKAERDISIGDRTTHNHFHAYPNGRQIPKVLSPTNPLYPQYFIGREQEMTAIHQRLSEDGQFLLLVNGKGGIGKTSLAARYYHKHYPDYLHLAWVLKEPGKSIVDALLSLEPQLGLKADAQTPKQRLEVLLRELTNLKAPSLLVIDNADDMADLEQHHRLLGGLTNLRIIFTTRVTELTDLPLLVIKGLSEAKALELFSHYYRSLTQTEEEMVRSIRKAVNANTLVLEILAKNLKQLNRLREYSLAQLLTKLEEGLLAIPNKQVSTPYQQLNRSTPEQIIKAMYDLAPLSEYEQNWLAIFAALPADNIPYEHIDLLLDYAEEREDALLSLVQKGWLDFAEDTKSFKVSPVVQVVVKGKYEGMDAALMPLVEGLWQNLRRDQLHHDNYALSTILVSYAEALLDSIANKVENDLAILFQNVGNFYIDTGDLYAALAAYQQMQQIYTILYKSAPEDSYYKNGLAISYAKLGDTQRALGDLDAVLDFYQDYNRLSKELHKAFPQKVSYKSDLAISYEKLGEAQSALGDLDAALGYFEAEVKLFEELHKDFPQNVSFKNGLAISYSKLGDIKSASGDLDAALGFFQEYNRLEQELHEEFPQKVSYKNNLAISFERLGATQSALGDLAAALGFYQEYNRLGQELHEDFPQNVSYKNGLAISYSKLGDIKSASGDLDTALSFYQDYHKLREELYESFPQNVSFKNGLAISYSKLGDTQRALGDLDAALGFFQEYNRLEQELHEEFPQKVSYKNDLAISFERLGSTQSTLGDLAAALGYYTEYNRLEQELHKAFPQEVEFKNGLAISLIKLGTFFRDRREDSSKAISYLQQAESLWIELVRDASQFTQFQKNLTWVQEALTKLDS